MSILEHHQNRHQNSSVNTTDNVVLMLVFHGNETEQTKGITDLDREKIIRSSADSIADGEEK